MKDILADRDQEWKEEQVLSDDVPIANTTWANLKIYAMQDDYKQQAWFVSTLFQYTVVNVILLFLIVPPERRRKGAA